MSDRTTLVLVSGGMDSALALLNELEEGNRGTIIAMHCDYGQAQRVPERDAARRVCETLSIPLLERGLPTLAGGGGDVVWARNLILVSIAANEVARRGGGDVVIGCCAEDEVGFPDCRVPFIDAVNNTLQLAELDVTVRAPSASMTKAQVLRSWPWTLTHEALAQTYSCYRGVSPPCGECPACVKRAAAFGEIGYPDPAIPC